MCLLFFFRNAKMLLRVAYAHLNQIAQHKGYCKLQLQLSVFIASAPSLTITFHAIVGFTHTHTHILEANTAIRRGFDVCVCVVYVLVPRTQKPNGIDCA